MAIRVERVNNYYPDNYIGVFWKLTDQQPEMMMDDIQAYKAKKKLRKKLNGKSWNLEGFHAESDVVIKVYAYDPFDSDEVALAGFTDQDLDRLKLIKEPIGVICGAVDQQFKHYVEASEKQTRKRVEELGVLLGLYMLNTSSYQTLCANDSPGFRHFIILLYRNRHTGECNLRPFSLVSKEDVLSAEAIKQYAQPVIVRDEAVNPGFFNTSPVVPIRE